MGESWLPVLLGKWPGHPIQLLHRMLLTKSISAPKQDVSYGLKSISARASIGVRFVNGDLAVYCAMLSWKKG